MYLKMKIKIVVLSLPDNSIVTYCLVSHAVNSVLLGSKKEEKDENTLHTTIRARVQICHRRDDQYLQLEKKTKVIDI